MSEFIFLFRGRETSGSLEDRQKHMEKWIAWFHQLDTKGQMKDPGHPLESTGKVVGGKRNIIKDGPFAETKDIVAGYIVVLAEDLDDATELARGCPILEVGGTVEVRPIEILRM